MTDHVINIAMDTKVSLQVHAPTDRSIAQKLETHFQNDVNHYLKTSLDLENRPTSRCSQTSRDRASAERQHMARRTALRTFAL